MYRLVAAIVAVLIFGVQPGSADVVDGSRLVFAQTEQTDRGGEEEAPETSADEEDEEPDCD